MDKAAFAQEVSFEVADRLAFPRLFGSIGEDLAAPSAWFYENADRSQLPSLEAGTYRLLARGGYLHRKVVDTEWQPGGMSIDVIGAEFGGEIDETPVSLAKKIVRQLDYQAVVRLNIILPDMVNYPFKGRVLWATDGVTVDEYTEDEVWHVQTTKQLFLAAKLD